MRLHLSEDARQRGEERVQAVEETVVGSVLSGVLPQAFGRIELWRVGRQLMHFEPMAVGLEPCPDLAVFVVRGVVLDQNGPLATISPGQLFEEGEVGGRVEDRVLAIVKSCAPEFDGAENLYTLALSGDRDFGWATYATPGSMQRGVLPETRLVGEDQRPVPRLGFFLSSG